MTELHIQVTHTKTAVNCGDHAQDITRAVAATPETTLQELIHGTLVHRVQWLDKDELNVADEDYVTIRVAKGSA